MNSQTGLRTQGLAKIEEGRGYLLIIVIVAHSLPASKPAIIHTIRLMRETLFMSNECPAQTFFGWSERGDP